MTELCQKVPKTSASTPASKNAVSGQSEEGIFDTLDGGQLSNTAHQISAKIYPGKTQHYNAASGQVIPLNERNGDSRISASGFVS